MYDTDYVSHFISLRIFRIAIAFKAHDIIHSCTNMHEMWSQPCQQFDNSRLVALLKLLQAGIS